MISWHKNEEEKSGRRAIQRRRAIVAQFNGAKKRQQSNRGRGCRRGEVEDGAGNVSRTNV